MNKIPKLRFKEFSGEWEEKRLEEIFEISKTKYNPLKETKEYPCIELESLSQETGKILKTFNSLEQKSIKNKFLKNEVLFGKLRPYLKKYWYSNFEGVCSSEIWVLNSKNNINKFIYYFIQGENFISLANTTSGTKMPRADWSLMKNEIFSIPNIQEQEKIADFLYSVDKKISITEEKLDLFKEYKKGIMQKIFNQELRFKDSEGNNYPEWEEKRLGDISSISAGGDIKKENFSENKTGEFKIPIYANSLEKNGLYGYSNIFKVEGESITVTARGNIGVATYRNENYVPIVRLLVIKMDSAKYSHKYFSYFINTIKIIQEVTGVPQLTAPQLREYKAIYPISLEEQEKIANFLSSIDNKIDNLAAELEDLKEFKKGLLQQMFV